MILHTQQQNVSTRPGRRRSTTQAALSHIALELFAERGFDETTVDDIAAAAGIGRRTFFRYFSSKNDLPWGDFDTQLDRMRAFLDQTPDDVPLLDALRAAVVDFNRVHSAEIPWHRQRMRLLFDVPALRAYSTLRYAAWRAVVAEYTGRRLGLPPDSLQPQALAWALLGMALAAYEQWLQDTEADLTSVLSEALQLLDTGFGQL